MPTYEYQCSACSHRFEQFQSMKDPALRKCPSCGKPRLERLIGTGAAVLFKGSGFYQTDYRSESYKKAADAESKPDSAKPQPTTGDVGAANNKPAEAKTPTPKPASESGSAPRKRGGEKKPRP